MTVEKMDNFLFLFYFWHFYIFNACLSCGCGGGVIEGGGWVI